MSTFSRLAHAVITIGLLGATLLAGAQEATIRKNLTERLPNLPKIDEITKTQMTGLYEVRVNHSDIFYTDAEGNYLIQGAMIDTRERVNLTEQRQNKLTTVAFNDLPFKDAFTIVRGNGKRKMAIFEDPNCGFCKRFEKDIAKINDVTIQVFLYPILGADSVVKSKAIWCAKDKARAFEDWMLRNIALPAAAANCDTSALERNVAFGQKQRITGTPTTFLTNGTRIPGAAGADKVEQLLADAK